jgi:hypothetical protein
LIGVFEAGKVLLEGVAEETDRPSTAAPTAAAPATAAKIRFFRVANKGSFAQGGVQTCARRGRRVTSASPHPLLIARWPCEPDAIGA